MKNKVETVILPALAAGIFAADQYAKQKSREMRPGEIYRSGNGIVLLRQSRNSGAMMNLGEKNPELVRNISILASSGTLLAFSSALGHSGGTVRKTGLAILLGGALSNTYDRLRRKYVTDYISFDIGVPELQNTVFNAADFAIIAGSVMTALGK